MRQGCSKMFEVEFTIPIEPMGQGRPRAASIGGRAKIYTPAKTRKWQQRFDLLSNQYAPSQPVAGPVHIDLGFYFRRPQRLMKKNDPPGAVPHTAKPDADNCIKIVLDSISTWFAKGDAQVQSISVQKFYAEKEKPPRIHMIFKEIEQ